MNPVSAICDYVTSTFFARHTLRKRSTRLNRSTSPESAMRKFLLPPLMILLLVACSDTTSVVSATDQSARMRSDIIPEVTVATATAHVLPAAYASVMGETNNIWPHTGAHMRYQQVFLGSELDIAKIDGLCLRHDELFGGRQSTVHLTVKLGPTQMDNTNLSNVFADNYSAAPTEVFSDNITIPQTSGAGTINSFDFCIDFTTSYSHPAGSNLIVEFVNTNTTATTHPKDGCAAGATGCTTRRVLAFNAAATTATFADNSGLIMSFFTADPEVKVDCMEDGWVEFGFRNQGQCIRFVETEKDSRQY